MGKSLAACAVCLLLAVGTAQAGKIEVEGTWYSFEDIIGPESPVEKRERPSGLTGYTGRPSDLTDKPARIVALLGKRWIGAHAHLAERFWPLSDVNLTIKDWDTRFPMIFRHKLPAFVKTESGSYELELSAGVADIKKTTELFQNLVFASQMATGNVLHQRCVVFHGRLTWSGLYNKVDQSKSAYTYTFLIEKIQVSNGWIPTAYGEKGISLEEATQICADKD